MMTKLTRIKSLDTFFLASAIIVLGLFLVGCQQIPDDNTPSTENITNNVSIEPGINKNLTNAIQSNNTNSNHSRSLLDSVRASGRNKSALPPPSAPQ